MPEESYNHPLFGHVRFRTVSPEWVRGDQIVFLSGFDSNDVTPVFIPQLQGIPGSNGGRLSFHRRGHDQLLATFRAIEMRGLLRHVRTCAGTVNRRLRKPVSGSLSRVPSNHAFGIAIDLNESDPGFGESVAPVAPVFQSFGFLWGKAFGDPMHFEVRQFLSSAEIGMRPSSRYGATKQHVANRGIPPDDFLDELVKWGKEAPDEIFAFNPFSDIYSNVKNTLGPWRDLGHRRAVMIEVMRVLAGFESSWNWTEGRDVTNPTSVAPETIEAGAWQVSANSIGFGQELEDLVRNEVGTLDAASFQKAMKVNHPLAMEYVARLLRRTTRHHGPVLRHQIDPWLRRDAVEELETLLG